MKTKLLHSKNFKRNLKEILTIKIEDSLDHEIDGIIKHELHSRLTDKFWIPMNSRITQSVEGQTGSYLTNYLEKLIKKTKSDLRNRSKRPNRSKKPI